MCSSMTYTCMPNIKLLQYTPRVFPNFPPYSAGFDLEGDLENPAIRGVCMILDAAVNDGQN
ncbi:hypothetical protein DPMN_078583 [Dreissena polymorpha]|uniref:Uncharacterized protein n=1 Tax=Dreissena polymorpha TaxID=45954 RepID=A0A9D4BQM0_DREPO|nr:hypothetical protein DPMN_078583 [Dreissena polymorpha]